MNRRFNVRASCEKRCMYADKVFWTRYEAYQRCSLACSYHHSVRACAEWLPRSSCSKPSKIQVLVFTFLGVKPIIIILDVS